MNKNWIVIIVVVVLVLLAVGITRSFKAPAVPSGEVPAPTTSPETKASACRPFDEATVKLGDTTLAVAVADTHEERIKGLSGCPQVPEGTGMYFVYSEAEQVRYWMKDMVVPIDIVWVAKGRVVGVVSQAPVPTPGTSPLPIYTAPVPVDGVLEIMAGAAKNYNVTVGTTVEYQPK